jgi:excisionase family DNA binding protein
LKTREVAEALGVGVSTIKRWVDSGVLRASRTIGKHRLISLNEAIRFAKAQGLAHAHLEARLGVGSGKVVEIDDAFRDGLVNALRRGRAAEVNRAIESAYASLDGAAQLADAVLRPAMERIGHEWEAKTLDVYQEHRASRIVETSLMHLIGKIAAQPSISGAPLAIGATPEGDLYTLSGLLCELALRELGWDVINLGANLPMASLASAVRVHRPKLVYLSINHLADPERFVREYQIFFDAASTTGAAVCLGGPALSRPLRARLVAASFGERIAHLAEFARRLAPTAQTRSDSPGSTGTETERTD